MPARLPAPAVANRAQGAWLVLLVFAVLGGVLFLLTRHSPATEVSLVERHRTNLQFRAGGWYVPGETNGWSGVLLDTYDDGTIRSRSVVSNGLLNGLSQGWHTNGVLQIEERFVAGTSHGRRLKWHANGQKLSEATISNGALYGMFRSWHENGGRAVEMEMKGGQPDGLSRSYYPDGDLQAEALMKQGQVIRRQYWKDGEHGSGAVAENGH